MKKGEREREEDKEQRREWKIEVKGQSFSASTVKDVNENKILMLQNCPKWERKKERKK